MAGWLPIIKVVLPYVAPIVSAARPAFTRKKGDETDPLVAQQVAELQEAVRTNTESAQALARAVEEAARANDRAIRQTRRIAALALVLAVLALAIALAGRYA